MRFWFSWRRPSSSCPNNNSRLINRSFSLSLSLPKMKRKKRSAEPMNQTTRRRVNLTSINIFRLVFAVAIWDDHLDTRSRHFLTAAVIVSFLRLRGRADGDVNSSDSQAKRSYASVSHVFSLNGYRRDFPFSIAAFAPMFYEPYYTLPWNWQRNRRQLKIKKNFVP